MDNKKAPASRGFFLLRESSRIVANAVVVPGAGIEPARSCPRQILSLLRLPISPSGQDAVTAIAYDSRARHDTKSVVRTIRERFRLLRTTAMRRTRLCLEEPPAMRLPDRVATISLPGPIPTLRLWAPRSRRGEAAHCDYSRSSMRAGPGAPTGKRGALDRASARSNRVGDAAAQHPPLLFYPRETMAQKKRPGCPGRFSNWRPRSELNRRTRICSPLHNHSATRPVTCHSILPAAASACNRCKPSPEKTKPRGRGFVSEDDSVTGGPLIWSGKRDSNSRPRPWQGRALPTELFPLKEAIF